MKTIYVGMALTTAPEEFRTAFQAELKVALRKIPEVEVLDFMGLEAGTAVDVFNLDKQHTQSADLMVAICDHASTGLGMEIVLRHQVAKPLVLFAHHEAKVARMVTGFAEVENYLFSRYASVEEIIAKVEETLATLS